MRENMQVNKLTLIGGALLASTMFEPIAASAYDLFSYRYEYTKQSHSPDREARSLKTKSVEPISVPHNPTPAVLRADDTSDSKETTSEKSNPDKPTSLSSKRVLISNPRN
jgi:hypothetical protein